MKSREATDLTYRQQEFVMPNEVLRNANRMAGDTAIKWQEIQPSNDRRYSHQMTGDTAIKSALVYKQEIHGIEGTSQKMWSDL